MRSWRSELWSGIRAQLPILLGTSPFGMIYGVNAAQAGLPTDVALGMSMFVFAGSAQFIAAQLFGSGTPGLVIIMTTFVVNLRHMLYSASMTPYVRHLSRAWKWLLAFLLTDEAYAVTITHYERGDAPPADQTNKHWHFFGAGITLWVSWQMSTAAGVLLGAQVPGSWALDFTLALTFIALLIPVLKDRPSVLAALSAGITAMVARGLPHNLGLIVAVLAGIAVGLVAEQRVSTGAPAASAPAPSAREGESCQTG